MHIQTPYCCTKSFVRYLSIGVSEEVKNKIDVYVSCPGPILTKILNGMTPPRAITPSECVTNILKDVGKTNESATHIKHELESQLNQFIFNCNLILNQNWVEKMYISQIQKLMKKN